MGSYDGCGLEAKAHSHDEQVETPMTNPSDPQQGWQQAQPGSAPPMQAPPPGYYYGTAQAQKQSTNGFAIASMVLGIIWIYWIGSILALVFGYMARKQIDES
ncbi:MAG TPA: DUF4190 domain-containing protein, partial [Acidimicrobiia bacterium]